MTVPRENGIFHARNFLSDGPDQKIRPRELNPEARPIRRRCTSDRAAISIYIATTAADVKLPIAAPEDQQHASALLCWTVANAPVSLRTASMAHWARRERFE